MAKWETYFRRTLTKPQILKRANMQENVNHSKIVSSLFLSVVLDYMSFSIALPLIPFYAQHFNASPLEITLLLGIFPVVAFFVNPFWGSLSDRVGYRICLLLSIAGTGISYLWFGFATSLWMLFIARIMSGLTGSSLSIARSYIARHINPINRTKHFALLQAALGIGFVLGPLVTSILVGSDPNNPHLRLPSYVAAIISCLAFSYVFMILPRKAPIPKAYKKLDASIFPTPKHLLEILQRPMILELLGIIITRFFVMSGSLSVSALWTEVQLGWGAKQFSYACIGGAVICTILLITFSKIGSSFQELNLAVWGLVATGSALLMVPFSTHLGYLIGVVCLFIGGAIVVNPILYSLISKVVGVKQQGETLGVVTSVSNLASFIGAAWSGFLFQTVGHQAPFIFGGFLLLGIAIWYRYRINHSRFSRINHQRRQQKLNYLFDFLDLDKNGVLELSDFEQTVAKIAQLRGWELEGQDYRILLSLWVGFGEKLQTEADSNRNGKIEREEWLEYLDGRLDYDFSEAFIKLIDMDQDGQIAIDEFKLFYQTYQLETDDAESIFFDLDFNQDGYLSHNEVQELFEQFLYSDDIQVPGNLLFGTNLAKKL